MVQMMNSRPKVKLEASADSHDYHHLHKRFKLHSSLQGCLETEDFAFPPSLYNPIDEPSPLGLRLKKSPSFLDLIQMRITQQNAPNLSILKKKDGKGNTVSGVTDKLKASNFPASLLRIGTWEYKSRHEGDLVAKCYFAKHKIVWEMLDGCLKNKIEIQWSDIVAIKASYPDGGQGTLDVVLARRPLFFRETDPQPKKHTLWKGTSDFTCGQASMHRRHFLQCSPGLLGKHFEKLIQCDPRLCFLSQQPEVLLESPYFEPRVPIFDDLNETGCASGLEIGIPATVVATQTSSSLDEHDSMDKVPENVCKTASPSSAIDAHVVEELGSSGIKERKEVENRVAGIHPSMSMSDLINHIGICISEQMASGNPSFSVENLQGRDIMGEISQYLSDSQLVSASDEQIMSRKDSVNDLLNLPRIASLPQFVFSISEASENQR